MQPIWVGVAYLVLSAFLFLLHCFLWTILRAIFWINLSQLSHLMDTILYWMPVGIQFSTFTLLVAFYAQGVYWREYRRYRRRFHVLCLILDSILISIVAVCIVLTSTAPGYRMGSDIWMMTGIISGSLYMLLLGAGAYYGARLIALFHSPKLPANLTSRSNRLFLVSTTIYMLGVTSSSCSSASSPTSASSLSLYGSISSHLIRYRRYMLGVFGSHAAWDFAAAARGDVDETMKKQVASGSTAARLACWELVPVAWLLYYFRSIGSQDYGPTLDSADPSVNPLLFGPAAPAAGLAPAAAGPGPAAVSSPEARASPPLLLEGSVPAAGLSGMPRAGERAPLLGDRREPNLFLNERRYDSDDEHGSAPFGTPAFGGSRTPSYGSLSSLPFARSASAHVPVPHRPAPGLESEAESVTEALSPLESPPQTHPRH
eukprot:tig00020614_g12203.t1